MGAVRKRFWDRVIVAAEEDGFRMDLDGRPVRRPGGASM